MFFLNIKLTKKQTIFLVAFPFAYCVLIMALFTTDIFLEPTWTDIDAATATGLPSVISKIIGTILTVLMFPVLLFKNSTAPFLDWLIIFPVALIFGTLILALYKMFTKR